jgi:hypothetical protein
VACVVDEIPRGMMARPPPKTILLFIDKTILPWSLVVSEKRKHSREMRP